MMEMAGAQPAAALLLWYAALCAVAVLNPLLLARTRRNHPPSSDPPRKAYQQKMFLLALPMVFECSYRSVFPSLYLQRYTFWDTPLNSILIDRTFACVGEITWTAQIALALAHVDGEVTGGRAWVRGACALAVLLYVVAEAVSYYNTATTNELWAAAEVVVDALSWIVLLPASLSLSYGLRHAKWTSAKIFVCVFSVAALVYPLYNFAIDAPMYLRRYAADQAAGKQYFAFVFGLIDAAIRRVPTRSLASWEGDMFWMVAYFTFGAWSSILLVCAPTTTPHTQAKDAQLLRVV
mmetsp:Transcript_24606/g.59363  ORF Transcript_24606/g.59363 Transcript_24606/m.59363 type:complete len:293 (-) Transcript_24606:292-1170(-)